MQSEAKITVSEHRIKELFIKRFSKQNRIVSGQTFLKYKKRGGGRGPLGPAPKSAYAGPDEDQLCLLKYWPINFILLP